MNALKASVQKTFLLSGGSRLLAFAVLAAGVGLASLPAEAARSGKGAAKADSETVAAVAVKDPETTSSIGSDDGPYCASSRKRLFVEGEGWIVRRVTTCY